MCTIGDLDLGQPRAPLYGPKRATRDAAVVFDDDSRAARRARSRLYLAFRRQQAIAERLDLLVRRIGREALNRDQVKVVSEDDQSVGDPEDDADDNAQSVATRALDLLNNDFRRGPGGRCRNLVHGIRERHVAADVGEGEGCPNQSVKDGARDGF